MLLETEVLNDVQSAAVRHSDGAVLIFAGAGSGKTRVLTHRIAYLLRELRIAPDRILAVTFTNKAAGEMKSRLQGMVGPVARDVWVGTFHAMCVRILRRDGTRIGIGPSFAVIDESDQRQLVKEILDDLDYDERQLSAGACLAEIDKAKNALMWPGAVRAEPDFVHRRAHRERLRRVPTPSDRIELARLRRLHRPHDRFARARRGDAREISAQVRVRPGRRVSGRQCRAVPPDRACSPRITAT